MSVLKDLAIKKALENDWQEAYRINQEILEENPGDIDTLNRLAFALIKIGKLQEAKRIYKKVISIDKTNPIAVKNLKKVASISKQSIKRYKAENTDGSTTMEDLFIEEAGKTKTVELKNVTDKKTLSLLEPGDEARLAIKRSKIFVKSQNSKYIGMLPDAIAMRLIPFIKAGNEYQAFIKSIDEKNVSVFIRETKKTGKFKNQLSFPSTSFFYKDSEGIEKFASAED